MLDWNDLLAAVAVLLVLEGLVPFASPAAMKRALVAILQTPENQLRMAGLASIATGLLLLWWVRA